MVELDTRDPEGTYRVSLIITIGIFRGLNAKRSALLRLVFSSDQYYNTSGILEYELRFFKEPFLYAYKNYTHTHTYIYCQFCRVCPSCVHFFCNNTTLTYSQFWYGVGKEVADARAII